MTVKTIKFEEIYSEMHEQVLAHTFRVIKNFHDSEDITMKVFAKIVRLNKSDATRFNPEKSALSTWVYMITNGAILDYLRTNKNKKHKFVSEFADNEGREFFEFEASKQSNADSEILATEKQAKIVKAFHDLKPKYRRVATLFFIREHTYEEISDMLNIPMGSVKGNIARARKMLQEKLDNVYVVTI